MVKKSGQKPVFVYESGQKICKKFAKNGVKTGKNSLFWGIFEVKFRLRKFLVKNPLLFLIIMKKRLKNIYN